MNVIRALRCSRAGPRALAHLSFAAALQDVYAKVRDALDRLAAESWCDRPAISLGTGARLSSPHWDAAAVAHQDDLVHLAAFAKHR